MYYFARHLSDQTELWLFKRSLQSIFTHWADLISPTLLLFFNLQMTCSHLENNTLTVHCICLCREWRLRLIINVCALRWHIATMWLKKGREVMFRFDISHILCQIQRQLHIQNENVNIKGLYRNYLGVKGALTGPKIFFGPSPGKSTCSTSQQYLKKYITVLLLEVLSPR